MFCGAADDRLGIRIINAAALLAAIGDGGAFANGNDLIAWQGLMLRQHSTRQLCPVAIRQRSIPFGSNHATCDPLSSMRRDVHAFKVEPGGHTVEFAAKPGHCAGGGVRLQCHAENPQHACGTVGLQVHAADQGFIH